jgi:hypothetical protein
VAVVTSLTVTSPQAEPLAVGADGSDAGAPDADDGFGALVRWELPVGAEVPPELEQAARLAQISATAPTASVDRDRMDWAEGIVIMMFALGAVVGSGDQQDCLGDPVQ